MSNTHENQSLADRLRTAREALGISQTTLAALAGMSQQTYSGLERGLFRRTSKIASIAKVLNVNAYWLETGEGTPNPTKSDSGTTARGVAEPRFPYGDPDEATLIAMFRQLPKKKKRAILDLMAGEQGASGD